MKPDAFDRLRAADPAARLPERDAHDREELRRAIVATPPDAQAAARRRARRRTRRLVVAAVAAGTVVLLGGTGVYAMNWKLDPWPSGPQPAVSGQQWNAEYERWTHRIPLPAGVEWRGLGAQVNAGDTFVGAGQEQATIEALGDWAREWAAAAAAGDKPRAARAEDWVVRLRATIPTIKDGGDESEAAVDKNYADNMDLAIAKARAGNFDWLVSTLADGYAPSYHPMDATAQSPNVNDPTALGSPDEILWIEYGPLDVVALSSEQGSAEYQRMFTTVGLPQGVATPKPPQGLPDLYLQMPVYSFELGWAAAWDAWCSEWVAAAKAGDDARAAAAAEATSRLLALAPQQARYRFRGDEGEGVIKWTIAERCLRRLEHITAQAREGDLSGIREWLDYQTSRERRRAERAADGS